MADRQSHYLAYMLRLWTVNGEGKLAWRASVEDALSGECRNFASLDALFDYLRARADRESGVFVSKKHGSLSDKQRGSSNG